MKRRNLSVFLGLLAAGAAVVALKTLPVEQRLLDLVAWIRSAGAVGVFVYVLTYVAAAVFMLPGSILTLGAGFAYGVLQGSLVVVVAANVGAVVAFLLGRTVAREWIARRVESSRRFAAVDRAVGDRGLRIVLLTRLSPVFPYNVLNYAYGLTQVRLVDFVVGSLVGMLPGTVMYVYLGSLIKNLAELAAGKTSGGSAQQVFFWAGLAVTVAVTLYVTRVARRALAEATGENGASTVAA